MASSSAIRSQTDSIKSRIITQLPPEGTAIASQVNRKGELGMLPLSFGIRVARQVRDCLKNAGIEYSFMGASAFGTTLPAPRRLASARPVSNLIDIQIKGEEASLAYASLTAAGWKSIDPIPYFSITFPKGEPRTLPTILNQGFFSKSFHGTEVYLAIIPVPTVMLQNQGGRLHTVNLPKLQTTGQVLAYKLIRGGDRDIMDILHLSTAMRLRPIFDQEAVLLIRDSQSGNPRARALSSRLLAISESLPQFGKAFNSDTETMYDNMLFLRELIRN